MIGKLKNFIYKIIRSSGYELIGRKNIVKHNSYDAIHKFILKEFVYKNIEDSKVIIFDVGANEGDSIMRFNNIFQNTFIHSFEPNPFLIQKIKNSKNLRNYKLNSIALSDKKEKKKFHFYKAHRVSSFYPMVENSKYKSQRFKDESDEEVKEIDVSTLDEYCKNNKIDKIDLLKIDTQGSEADVLAGSKHMLSNKLINIIELEYIIGIAHKNSCNLYDIEKQLYEFGYKLIAIENADNVLSFSNYQTNLIYVKKDIYLDIERFHQNNLDVKNVTNKV